MKLAKINMWTSRSMSWSRTPRRRGKHERPDARHDAAAGPAARKGFAAIDDVRGLLAVASDQDEAAYERAGYVSAMRKARDVYEPR